MNTQTTEQINEEFVRTVERYTLNVDALDWIFTQYTSTLMRAYRLEATIKRDEALQELVPGYQVNINEMKQKLEQAEAEADDLHRIIMEETTVEVEEECPLCHPEPSPDA
jgi:uncharacterized protein Yka (UPF0111/DUF47 family)